MEYKNRSILKATINHSTQKRRVTIRLLRNPDDSLGWFGPDGSCDITCPSVAEAKEAAIASWGSEAWDLRAAWLRPFGADHKDQDWGEDGDPDYDPTPYETGEPDNLPREAQERAVEEMRYKR